MQYKIHVTYEINEYNCAGEIIIDQEYIQAEKEKFWNFIRKDVEIQGFRKGKVTWDLFQKHGDMDNFNESFIQYIRATSANKIFEAIRSYPPTINKSYLNSTLAIWVDDEKNIGVRFLLNMAGSIQLPNVLNFGSLKVEKKDLIKEVGKFEHFLKRRKIFFWKNHTTYSNSTNPAQIGDMVYFDTAKIYLKNKPKEILQDFGPTKMVVGSNAFLPAIDEELVDGAPSVKKKKIEFIFPIESSIIWAGQEATFEYRIVDIESPKHPSFESLFDGKKSIDGFKSSEKFEEEIKKMYDVEGEQATFDLQTKIVTRKLLEQIPDFDFDTTYIRKSARNEAKKIEKKKINTENIISKLETHFGTFESDKNLPLEEKIYQTHYYSEKVEKLLSYIFHNFAQQIIQDLDTEDDDEKIWAEAEEIAKNPTEYGYDEDEDKDAIYHNLQKVKNQRTALTWLTTKALENKGKIKLEK